MGNYFSRLGNYFSKLGNYFSKQRPERPRDTEASSPTTSKRRRREKLVELQSEQRESESPHLLPSSDSLEKIDVPSASGANSDPSASSTSVNGNDYYVFLSFRGPDTRNGFVDHLYHRLKAVGLPFHPNFVFRDDENLPFGQKIGENLISAIKHSKVSIPVISVNYAASEWCLRELIQIMECEERGEQKVLPMLYKVKPYEVRELKGAFGQAFQSRKDRFDEKVKQQGPVALRKALDLRVFESEKFANGHEAELITELVRVITDEQQHDFLPPLPGNLVGIDDHVAEVMKLADTDPSDIRIIGICGIGGIGKTTLATNIYNKLAAKKFDCRSFLMDIRETIDRKGMEHIQNVLISDITANRGSHVPDSMRGIGKIQSSCNGKKVLIVLDNVGDRDHLDKLIGGCNFGLGSRIIITCRDKALLESEYKCYELKEMNDSNSMLLFCLHAFRAKQPPTELATLSGNIVATTGGLPLMLEIIGSSLKRKGKDEVIWTETLEKLRKVPPRNVREKLKMSYDLLDDQEKRMFLDIACFFIGYDERFVTYLWKDLGLCPAIGLARMIDLSLIKYGDNDGLRMHDQLRDLGRDIACPADKESWYWSRLWGEEAMKVLRRKEENRYIEALRLDKNGSKMFMNRRSFERMPCLKYLHLSEVDFDGNFEDSLSELRWLEWEKCPDSFEATNVHLENLLMLDLSSGYISHEWRGWSSIKMERLKVLNLSQCIELKVTPNLSVFKSLEMLILEECYNLEEIDPSIGDLKILKILRMSGCRKLSSLPSSISNLGKLEELDATACDIREGRVPINGLLSLRILLLGKVGYTGGLPFMHEIELLESASDLSSRRNLDLTNCDFPANLTILEVTCPNCEFPKLSHLTYLKQLSFQFCEFLESIPVLPSGILKLSVIFCGKLKKLQSLSSLELLSQLHIMWCNELMEIEGLERLKSLTTLSLCGCNKLLTLDDLKHLESLNALHLNYLDASLMNDHLFQVQCLGRLKNLKVLCIISCQSFRRLDISQLTHLTDLIISECKDLVEIEGLERLKGLSSLYILQRNSIRKLPDLGNLRVVGIAGCSNLHDVFRA